MLNRMCNNCKCLGNDCKGEINHVYTGCVFKKQDTSTQENNSCIIGMSTEEVESRNINKNKLMEVTR